MLIGRRLHSSNFEGCSCVRKRAFNYFVFHIHFSIKRSQIPRKNSDKLCLKKYICTFSNTVFDGMFVLITHDPAKA